MGSKHPKGGRKDRSGKPGPKSKKVNKKAEQKKQMEAMSSTTRSGIKLLPPIWISGNSGNSGNRLFFASKQRVFWR